MQSHHEQLILFEDKARKLALQIREKKKIQGLKKGDEQIFSKKVQNYTMEDLEKLQQEIQKTEQMKIIDE